LRRNSKPPSSRLEIERKHPTRKIALLFGDAPLFRIGEQGWIKHPVHFGMLCQPVRNALGILAGPIHAQIHRGQTPIQHPTFICLQDIAKEAAFLEHHANQFGIAGDRGAADHVAESGKVFGCRIEAHVCGQRQRMMERRANLRRATNSPAPASRVRIKIIDGGKGMAAVVGDKSTVPEFMT
jgi:hypothetical protein